MMSTLALEDDLSREVSSEEVEDTCQGRFPHQFILQFGFSFKTEGHVVNLLPQPLPLGSFSPLPVLRDAPAFVQHCCLLPRAWGSLHIGRWINDFFVICSLISICLGLTNLSLHLDSSVSCLAERRQLPLPNIPG